MELLEDHVKAELEDDVLLVLDSVTDETFVTTPLYKIMALLPTVYFLEVTDNAELLVKIGKTVDNLSLLNEII